MSEKSCNFAGFFVREARLLRNNFRMNVHNAHAEERVKTYLLIAELGSE